GRRRLATGRPLLRAHRQRAHIPPPPGGGLMPPRRAPGSAWGLDTEPADDWRDLAACRDEDPELFFPIGTSGPALLQVEQAKAVCRRCSVIDQCLAEALQRREMYGIWGGTTEAERAELIRRQTEREYPDMLRERYGGLAAVERERPPARPPDTEQRRALIKAMEAVQAVQ